MSAAEALRSRAAALLEGSTLAGSACGGALMAWLRPVLAAGVVTEDRAGGGRQLRVRDAAAFRLFFQSHFPASETSPETAARFAATARYRDSKALRSDTPPIVMLRAWSDSALSQNGLPVPAAAITAERGVFSFVLPEGGGDYELCAPCALVENPAVLLNFEQLGLTSRIPVAIYAGGRVSRKVLQWMARMDCPAFQVTHFPDYDPVGLSEFVRVHQALGDRAGLWLPGDLESRFARFSNPKLLRKRASQALLPALRACSLPVVRRVLALMENHGAGLEQEALFLPLIL